MAKKRSGPAPSVRLSMAPILFHELSQLRFSVVCIGDEDADSALHLSIAWLALCPRRPASVCTPSSATENSILVSSIDINETKMYTVSPEAPMAENVVYLHPQPEPIAHYLRIGTLHRQVERLLAAGRLPVERIVVEGAAFARQKDVVAQLADAGRELILDTNAAELSSAGRWNGAVSAAPWAYSEGALQPDHFTGRGNHDVIGLIARFAVEHGFSAVHAPTHLLDNSTDGAFQLDRQSCVNLRRALDGAGGKDIAVDYPLTIKNASLRDPAQRRAFIAGLVDLPFDNLWLRISGFGADARAPMLRRYIAAMIDFQRLDKPIVADNLGVLAALATGAFGAAGGGCHGLGEKERFDASDWNKPPVPGGGGRQKRILIPGLDRLLSLKQVDVIVQAEGARRLLSCHDRDCCPNGLADTLKDPKAHYIRQRANQFARLSRLPRGRRVADFVKHELADAARTAADAAKLNLADESTGEMLRRNSERLERMGPILTELHNTMGDDHHSLVPRRRATRRVAASGKL